MSLTVPCGRNDIVAAIEKAMSKEHKEKCKRVISPYGDGHAAERIAGKSYQVLMGGRIDLKKKFYDWRWDE